VALDPGVGVADHVRFADLVGQIGRIGRGLEAVDVVRDQQLRPDRRGDLLQLGDHVGGFPESSSSTVWTAQPRASTLTPTGSRTASRRSPDTFAPAVCTAS
jgi:hypothetical protein